MRLRNENSVITVLKIDIEECISVLGKGVRCSTIFINICAALRVNTGRFSLADSCIFYFVY